MSAMAVEIIARLSCDEGNFTRGSTPELVMCNADTGVKYVAVFVHSWKVEWVRKGQRDNS